MSFIGIFITIVTLFGFKIITLNQSIVLGAVALLIKLYLWKAKYDNY